MDMVGESRTARDLFLDNRSTKETATHIIIILFATITVKIRILFFRIIGLTQM